jgi:hypothetical protein
MRWEQRSEEFMKSEVLKITFTYPLLSCVSWK